MSANRSDELRGLAAAAIEMVRHHVRWKSGKDIQHLEKRISRGHLPSETSLDQYNQLIQKNLKDPESDVYHYSFGLADYFAVISEIDGKSWLVLMSAKGMMETAFPPDDVQEYLAQNNYVFLGKSKELFS